MQRARPNIVTDEQVMPKGEGDVLPYLLNDLVERSELGCQKYGEFLATENGRDAMMDAYQKALDLVIYLKQALMERDGVEETEWARAGWYELYGEVMALEAAVNAQEDSLADAEADYAKLEAQYRG